MASRPIWEWEWGVRDMNAPRRRKTDVEGGPLGKKRSTWLFRAHFHWTKDERRGLLGLAHRRVRHAGPHGDSPFLESF